MNKDLIIMLKILLAVSCIIFILVFPRITLLLLFLVFFRAMYIQRYNYQGFIRRIKYTFKL